MTDASRHLDDLLAEVEIPVDGTLSRTLHDDEQVKVVVFAFDRGQVLSRHTAATPAIVQVLRGHLTLTLDEEAVVARPGSWTYMPAELPHAVRVEEPSIMLLTLLRRG